MLNSSTDTLDYNGTDVQQNLLALDIAWFIIILAITLLSLFGNFLVCATLFRRPYLLTPSNRLVLSLTVSNMIYTIAVLPFSLASSISKKWLFGEVWCIFVGGINLTIVGCSMLTLLCISADRYFVIVFPMNESKHLKSFHVMALLIVSWLFSFSAASVPIFKFQYKFISSAFTCLPAWGLSAAYTLFWILCFVITPYICILVFYCCIYAIACSKHKRVRSSSSCKFPRNLIVVPQSQSVTEGISPTFPENQRTTDDRKTFLSEDTCSGDLVSNIHATRPLYARTQITSHPHEVESKAEIMRMVKSQDIVRPSVSLSSAKPTEKNQSNPVSNILFSSNQLIMGSEALDCGHTPPREIASEKFNQHVFSSSSHEAGLSCSQRGHRSGKQIVFSHISYYRNLRKGCCTIFAIVGSLLAIFGPFAVVTIILALSGGSSDDNQQVVPDWMISLSTILLHTSSVYYPIIYGLWNETLRKEIISILGRKSRGMKTRRTRILSLSTQLKGIQRIAQTVKDIQKTFQLRTVVIISTDKKEALRNPYTLFLTSMSIVCVLHGTRKVIFSSDFIDLGLSPRITTAIMGESATMASIVYPMQVDSKIVKRAKSSIKRKTSRTESPRSSMTSLKRSSLAVGRFHQVKVHPKVSISLGDDVPQNDDSVRRSREQPMEKSQQFMTENDILGSELLQSALLYGLSDNIVIPNESAISSFICQAPASTRDSGGFQSGAGCSDTKAASPTPHFLKSVGSLLHLEAGEPIKIRKWDKPKVVDFFAQTLAFDLIDEAKKKDK